MEGIKEEPIFVGNRMVGKIVTIEDMNDTYFLTTRLENHFFIKFRGFGIAKEVIELLISRKIPMIKMVYSGRHGKIMYKAKPETFKTRGKSAQEGDFEEQYILATDEFDETIR